MLKIALVSLKNKNLAQIGKKSQVNNIDEKEPAQKNCKSQK